MNHYHVNANAEDGPEIYPHIFAALEGARYHVDQEADYNSQGSHVDDIDTADRATLQTALRTSQRADELSVLVANIDNLTDHFAGRKRPAPLYRENTHQQMAGLARLVQSAEHTIATINATSEWISVYECDGNCDQSLCDVCEDAIVREDDVWVHQDDEEYDHTPSPRDEDDDDEMTSVATVFWHNLENASDISSTDVNVTLRVGQLISFLSRFDPETQVTIDAQDVEHAPSWLNITGAFLPNWQREDEGPSVLLVASDTFDMFQF